LSNTDCDTTLDAASSYLASHGNRTTSITTHTITSLDPVPIQTSQLMEGKEEEKETKEQQSKPRLSEQDEDVICLPLTIDMKIFCLERLMQCLSANIKRINEVWPMIDEHFKSLISAQQNHKNQSDRHIHYFFERITVNIMKLCVELMDDNVDNIERVIAFLNMTLSLDDMVLFIVGRRIIAGIKLLLNIHHECFAEEKEWKIILFLMKRFANNSRDKLCCLEAFQLIEFISENHLNVINFNHVLSVLIVFGKAGSKAPIHNTRVIKIMLSIHDNLIQISNNNPSVLSQMFHKTLSNIARYVGTSNDYKTRQFALNSLHRALLDTPLDIEKNENSKLLFETILFPLLLQLTKLENQRLNEGNVSGLAIDDDDLRLKLLTLVFQVWLHDIHILIESDRQFHVLWFKFLATMRKFILMVDKHPNNGANLVIHCCESLKNVILVFEANDVFNKLAEKTGQNIWEDTWKILDEIAPNLKQEIVEVDAVEPLEAQN